MVIIIVHDGDSYKANDDLNDDGDNNNSGTCITFRILSTRAIRYIKSSIFSELLYLT